MINTKSYAAFNSTDPLRPFTLKRRKVGDYDVQIEILYCGVCHSDIHTARSEWPGTVYPVVPGHEIVGKIIQIGTEVKSLKVGDLAGVGCMVDSCRICESCRQGHEQYCDNQATVFTYNSPDKHIADQRTYGGYSKQIVVDERFVLSISPKLDLAATAPLLCAGITTYSPLKHWQVQKGMKVGIVGLGGLGHMGLKFSHALGCETVLFTTSPAKTADAKRLGAAAVVNSKNETEMKQHLNSFDFILNTVAASHNLDAYTELLKRDATMCLVGAPATAHPSPSVMNLIFKRRQIAGSLIGGIKQTQEMLDFCAEHTIVSEIELIPIEMINQAYERILKSDVKYRFVIDMSSL